MFKFNGLLIITLVVMAALATTKLTEASQPAFISPRRSRRSATPPSPSSCSTPLPGGAPVPARGLRLRSKPSRAAGRGMESRKDGDGEEGGGIGATSLVLVGLVTQ